MALDNKIIKLSPFFSKKIWGGNKLKELGFNIPSDDIGEAWVISAHENGMSFLKSNKNISFKNFFEENRSLFGNIKGDFPLLSKIITANDFLSVQVHPNDDYAIKKHNSFGKPESWYIIDCPENAKLIYGHNANNLNEFETLIKDKNWNSLLKEISVKKGDFLYVEPGKIHAITPGVIIYELQRSSDITYRLYDYDRVDNEGNARELHIKEIIDNISIPDSKDIIIKANKNLKFNCDFFSIEKIKVSQFLEWKKPENLTWYQFTVLSGNGIINKIDFKTGDSVFCVDKLESLKIEGNLEILISWIESCCYEEKK
ncbi:type I phosphomannose isomerase catalytic subunit [Spiroplasma taiwanense]|uniref:Mannose-6-phosphate isomerase n=1 Tax=Spiroplasma taiwanense CT-1 TaxID=1276220 RepID=S5MAK6_9MOLU|nr:type I phosphomannose isomerase catalytic subunit [Spiroplasma taiwanense]AGR40788.1 mannose-6-phosphate isomerase [Spiroplasma taiwanense CT-1]